MLNNTRISAVSPTSIKHSKYRVGFFGDTRVGKTSIVKRYVYDQFEHAPSPTIGVDFLSKLVFLKNRTVRLSTWDTAGEPRFRPLMPSYMRDSEVAVVVYDVTNRTSFLNTAMWVDLIRMQRGNDILIVLVGNKADLSNRQVGTTEGEKQAKMDGLLFMECSAKSGDNVQGLFQMIIASLIGKEDESNNAVDVENAKNAAVNTNVSAANAPEIGSGSCFRFFFKYCFFNISKPRE
mmetsp:Transcript_28331/g.41136  ORF Transcript_28331/g.41136 Transcript_28331/m.41136 type:complete len:235 (+) Transcript_28331:60-764(+)